MTSRSHRAHPAVVHAAYVLVLGAALMTLGTGQAAAAELACGATLTEDTTLQADLTDCAGDGLVIGADGITLDLAGHTVDSAGYESDENNSAGIDNSEGHDGLTVTGGAVQQFSTGIELGSASSVRLRELTVAANYNGISTGYEAPGSDIVVVRSSVTDNGGVGISLTASDSLVKGNVVIDNGSLGVLVEGDDNVVEWNEVLSNQLYADATDLAALSVFGTDNRVRRNDASDNLHGIAVAGADTRVERNVATGNVHDGISVLGEGPNGQLDAVGIVLDRNDASDNGDDGIWVRQGTDTEVTRNTATDNGDDGIQVLGSSATLVERNIASRNGGDGIVFDVNLFSGGEGRVATVERNVADHNGDDGIDVSTASLNPANLVVVERNLTRDNGDDGIFIEDNLPFSTPTVVERNVADRNGDDGIDVQNPATTLTRNVAVQNVDLGFEAVVGTTDGGGNRARRNGDPAQCLNVSCS